MVSRINFLKVVDILIAQLQFQSEIETVLRYYRRFFAFASRIFYAEKEKKNTPISTKDEMHLFCSVYYWM